MDNRGKETTLHMSTGGADASYPYFAVLIRDMVGNLYGTASLGGDLNCGAPFGCGTVFKIDASGKETVLHRFIGPDGANPYAGLLRGSGGKLYGTTNAGGMSAGVVFNLALY